MEFLLSFHQRGKVDLEVERLLRGGEETTKLGSFLICVISWNIEYALNLYTVENAKPGACILILLLILKRTFF